jgi:hypothetical protein
MNTYLLSLFAHLLGFSMLAGTIITTVFTSRQFWKTAAIDKMKAAAMLEGGTAFPIIMGVGMLLLILSGMSLLRINHGTFAEQTWFRIKMLLMVLLIINGFIGRRIMGRAVPLVISPQADVEKLGVLKARVMWLNVLQLAILLTVLILAVFKFN